jgi:hypothetical protein
MCEQSFKTKRGLSHHERNAHSELRNRKREEEAQPAPPQAAAKGYGKVWSQEEVALMPQLQARFRSHPNVAKEMAP